ncbi:MAG: TAXI family TRAP transporter solute-binding subunit [Planctomycetales bacterium]
MLGLLLFSAALLLAGGWLLTRSWRPRTYPLHMLTSVVPTRVLLAKRIAEQARRNGLEIDLTSRSSGTLEALELVDSADSAINLALITGGVSKRDYSNIRQVTSLTLEPLQVLVREELLAGGIAGLKGKRINLGPITTATHAVASDVLAFAGFHSPENGGDGDYVIDYASPEEVERQVTAIRALADDDRDRARRDLPDAMFLFSPLPSVLAKDLITIAGFRLMPIPFADAYCLDRLTPSSTGDIRIDRANFSPIEVPAFVYGLEPAVPATPCRTIGNRLLLVAYGPTEREAIARLLTTIYDGSIFGLVEPQPLRGQVPQFPLHEGTELFLHRNEPILSPELLASVGKVSGGVGALLSGMIAFYGFLRLRQLRRFEAYYHEIRRIELVARGKEVDPAAPLDPIARRTYLEDQLLDLKCEALQDFAEGGLKGEGLMSGIVSLVNDTRSSLARLLDAPADSNKGPSDK